MTEVRFEIPGWRESEDDEIVQAQIAPPGDGATLAHL